MVHVRKTKSGRSTNHNGLGCRVPKPPNAEPKVNEHANETLLDSRSELWAALPVLLLLLFAVRTPRGLGFWGFLQQSEWQAADSCSELELARVLTLRVGVRFRAERSRSPKHMTSGLYKDYEELVRVP